MRKYLNELCVCVRVWVWVSLHAAQSKKVLIPPSLSLARMLFCALISLNEGS